MSIRRLTNAVMFHVNLTKLDILGAASDLGLISDEKAEEMMKDTTMDLMSNISFMKNIPLEKMFDMKGEEG